VVWFKGGSEPGVLTLDYMVRAADGRLLTVSLLLHDPDRAFDQNAATAEAITLARGAVQLATRRAVDKTSDDPEDGGHIL
jgi:hypothetical protein